MRSLATLFVLILLTSCTSKKNTTNVINSANDSVVVHEVKSTNPLDGATNVTRETGVTFYFGNPIDSTTISINKNDNLCTGSLGLSSDGFFSCVQLSHYIVSSDKKSVTIFPYINLTDSIIYKGRVDSTVKDSTGLKLDADYTQLNGFRVFGGTPLTIDSISPSDKSTTTMVGTDITINFSEIINSASLTNIISGTTCSGTIQLSTTSSFSSCLPFSTTAIPSNGPRTFTLTPKVELSEGMKYYIRVHSIVSADSDTLSGVNDSEFTTTSIKKVRVSWTKSRESGVNELGGGYRVYYSQAPIINIYAVSREDVRFDSGTGLTPTEHELTLTDMGNWYFRITSYSTDNLVGSDPSEEIVIDVI